MNPAPLTLAALAGLLALAGPALAQADYESADFLEQDPYADADATAVPDAPEAGSFEDLTAGSNDGDGDAADSGSTDGSGESDGATSGATGTPPASRSTPGLLVVAALGAFGVGALLVARRKL